MLIEMHVHTVRGSVCSKITPEELVREARSKGLSAVCITEHDFMWEKWSVEALTEQAGLRILQGMEVTTNLGHVLVYGLPQYLPGIFDLRRLHQMVREHCGYMVLAHPFRIHWEGHHSISRRVKAALPLVDGVEIVNGSDTKEENQAAYELATRLGLPGIAGSDAHTRWQLGTCVLDFHHLVDGETTLVRELKAGRYRIVDRRTGTA
ncbi:hypothetical protein SY88_15790 [Clostridiales bacterium PH28_bin88]|nr:hypothetical protein SY88_15790 [Clostridiales bacterium PH28_bin88]